MSRITTDPTDTERMINIMDNFMTINLTAWMKQANPLKNTNYQNRPKKKCNIIIALNQ